MIFAENCMKLKEIGPRRRRVPNTALGSASAMNLYILQCVYKQNRTVNSTLVLYWTADERSLLVM